MFGEDYPGFPLPALHMTFPSLDTPIPNTHPESLPIDLDPVLDRTLFVSLMNIYRISYTGPWDR